jgi:hypothetical protein
LQHPTCVQLDASLDSNKSEKHQKESFKRFFASLGFKNIDIGSDMKLTGATTVSNAGVVDRRSASQATTDDAGAITWSDLYEIHLE